jgi:hypothetical protein
MDCSGPNRRCAFPYLKVPTRTTVSLCLHYSVRRERCWFTVGANLARELVRSPGSNRSNGGGNEVVEAFGVEGREGDLASVRAVM